MLCPCLYENISIYGQLSDIPAYKKSIKARRLSWGTDFARALSGISIVFVAIDTPGVRKRTSLANNVEYYGLVRAQKSIRRADAVLMFFDATETVSRVDKKLVQDIVDHAKPCIFVVNKWDLGLGGGMTSEKWADYLLKSFPTMRYVPVAFLTAKDGTNIKKVVNLAQAIFKQSRIRVSTSRLNKVVRAAVARNAPPRRRNRFRRLRPVTAQPSSRGLARSKGAMNSSGLMRAS